MSQPQTAAPVDGAQHDDDAPAAPSGAGRRVFLETFGCQMNVLDSELVRDQMLTLGYRFVAAADDADVVLYNTCAVRQQSEQKVLSRLGVMRQKKRENPGLIVGMLGCMAERTGESLAAELKHLDVVVGPSELDRLPGLLEELRVERLVDKHAAAKVALSGHTSRRSRTLDAAMDRLEALDQGRLVDPDAATAQAYVRITRGCNKFCSFCVVPYTRGAEVHRDADAIVHEVQKLVAGGAKEVTLLGQTINHYRHGDTSFAQLLRRVHDENPGLRRLRFLTSYPRDFTDEALDVMASSERMCPFLHVPAQSGSDDVLKRMNRGYTRGQYLDFIGRAKERIKDLAIVGDMIVGYPGETDDDFEASLSLLREVRYKTAYVFRYSPRPGTVSSWRDVDDVPADVKRDRNQRMLQLQQDIALSHHEQKIGTTLEVFVEGHAKRDPHHKDHGAKDSGELIAIGSLKSQSRRPAGSELVRLTGRTAGDHLVHFDGNAALVGGFAKVTIDKATPLSLSGTFASVA